MHAITMNEKRGQKFEREQGWVNGRDEREGRNVIIITKIKQVNI